MDSVALMKECHYASRGKVKMNLKAKVVELNNKMADLINKNNLEVEKVNN